MRIAVTYWTRRRVGGTESYLESIIPQLLAVGHEVGFWYEVDEPADRPVIELPPSVPVWCVSENGADEALRRLREWQPDVIYGQSLADPQLELETLKIAPGILFAHAYYGSCISGSKSFQRPTTRPCDRQFGWQCLVNYYPRRCGGLSPLTMIGEYRKQQSRRSLLSKYRFVVTHSTHMRDEYIRQGCEPARVQCLSYYAHKTSRNPEMVTTQPEHHSITCSQRKSEIENAAQAEWRLLFL
ncbi:MAG TPA: hypothetical protein VGW32_06590, partial [Pyrinomonadaceae bacterium]|nr:hypothetical protein [Pyrinomonadaceae bacterium]